jgi:hypothetical protein
MDANEDIYKKSIRKALTNKEGLNMVEVVGEFTRKKDWHDILLGL